MDRETLIAFEHEIADLFRQAKIRAPVHLCSGNEDILINIFKHVKPTDWVVSTHRSHLHALLKGIPPEWLKREILAGHSITLNNREHRFFTSDRGVSRMCCLRCRTSVACPFRDRR